MTGLVRLRHHFNEKGRVMTKRRAEASPVLIMGAGRKVPRFQDILLGTLGLYTKVDAGINSDPVRRAVARYRLRRTGRRIPIQRSGDH